MPESRIIGAEAASRKSRIHVECSVFVAEVLPFEWRDELQVLFHRFKGRVAYARGFGWRLRILPDVAQYLGRLFTFDELTLTNNKSGNFMLRYNFSNNA